MIWRRILAAVLATSVTAVAVPVTAAQMSSPVAVASAVSTPYRVVPPKPTGPYAVGTTEVHLTDSRRADPWRPGKRRELLVSIWYPTRSPQRHYAGRARAKPWGRHPVLLYSPGSGESREDLASHGYVVVTIDHTGEPGAVKKATDAGAADVRFVLDSLPRLPRRLRHAMDLDQIGMFGAPMGPERSIRTSRWPSPDMRWTRFSATF